MSLLSTLKGYRARTTGDASGSVVDLSFELAGEMLPKDYRVALAAAIGALLPWSVDDEFFGIHPVRAPLTDAGFVLSRRSRLQLRAPASHTDEVSGLVGQPLLIGGATFTVGRVSVRPVTPFATLNAHLVIDPFGDEQAFMDDVGMQLEILEVKAEAMCGKASRIAGPQGEMSGFALVLHGLSAADSRRMQAIGLGPGRRFGCGLFVPHKIIELPDASPE